MFFHIALFVLAVNFEVAISNYRQLTLKEVAILKSWTKNQQNMWQLSGQFEGDMVLTTFQRNGVIDLELRWPNREIPYEFSSDFTEQEKNFIAESLEAEYSKTCIKIRPRENQDKDYVHITGKDTGCWSFVGRSGNRQGLNLQRKGCVWRATIAHEFMHAAGFYHQQSATERDNYVDIMWKNIITGAEFNFDKYEGNVISNFGQKYDYDSVMHYDKFAFSSNGQPTIIPKDASANIGQRNGLSEIDIIKINKMYNCE